MNESINFKEYSERVLVNESVLTHVDYDIQRLKRAALLVTLSNQILNEVKRELFYKKENPQKYKELNEKLQEVLKNNNPPDIQPLENTFNIRVLHALLGMSTESAELLENIPKMIEGENMDNVNLSEELGDVFWYQAVLIDELKTDVSHTLEINAKKLEKRYKKGFNLQEAINRDIDAERQILEE